MPEDLAVTILINSRVGPAAFKSAQDHGAELDLAKLPDMPLEETSVDMRGQVARLIADVARWDGFAASVATKVLHKKRPRLVPILDNQAIFGAYMNPHWPGQRSATDSIYAEARIRDALEWISADLLAAGEHRRVGRPVGYRAHTVTNRVVRHGVVGAFPATRTRAACVARVVTVQSAAPPPADPWPAHEGLVEVNPSFHIVTPVNPR